MKKVLVTLAVVALLPLTAEASEEAEAAYSDPVYGFSLHIPELGEAEGALVVQRASFFAPPRDGFAANCNVQVQFLEMTLPAFMDMTLKQLKAAGLELVANDPREVSALPGTTFEYMGMMGDQDLRFIALAVRGEDRFWLVTCTAPAQGFEQYRASFARVLESFEVEGAAGPRAP